MYLLVLKCQILARATFKKENNLYYVNISSVSLVDKIWKLKYTYL